MKSVADTDIVATWKWLSKHRHQIELISGPDDPTWHRMLDKLHRLSTGLYFELSRDVVPREMIFTAHGDRRLFGLIDRIVKLAPEWPHWSFFALKPPRGMLRTSVMFGVDFRPDDFWFIPLRNRKDTGFLGIRIWIPGFHDRLDARPYVEISWQIIEALVGERESAELVDHVDVCGSPDDPVASGFGRIQELEQFLKAERERRIAATHSSTGH